MADSSRSKTSERRQQRTESSAQEPGRQLTPTGPHAGILGLQRAAGNQAVSQLVQPDTKGSPTSANGVPPIVEDVLKSEGGQPLDPGVRASMEVQLDEDFSQVRVHTEKRGAESARILNAWAYAVGSHIVFDEGQYAPHTAEGRDLLAHELTHVVQQQATDPQVQLASKEGTAAKGTHQTARETPINVHIVLHLRKVRIGVAIDDFAWRPLTEPPESLPDWDQAALYKTIRQAKEDFERLYHHKLKEGLESDQVEFDVQVAVNWLQDENLRKYATVLIGQAILQAVHNAKMEEEFRETKAASIAAEGDTPIDIGIAPPVTTESERYIQGVRQRHSQPTEKEKRYIRDLRTRHNAPVPGSELYGSAESPKTQVPHLEKGKHYVDEFSEIVYNPYYRSGTGRFSTWLQVLYDDPAIPQVDISIDTINDESISNEEQQMIMIDNGNSGGAGRVIFPERLDRSTTPRLWEIKQHVRKYQDEVHAGLILETFPIWWSLMPTGPASMGKIQRRIAPSPSKGTVPIPGVRKTPALPVKVARLVGEPTPPAIVRARRPEERISGAPRPSWDTGKSPPPPKAAKQQLRATGSGDPPIEEPVQAVGTRKVEGSWRTPGIESKVPPVVASGGSGKKPPVAPAETAGPTPVTVGPKSSENLAEVAPTVKAPPKSAVAETAKVSSEQPKLPTELTSEQAKLLQQAKDYYIGHKGAVGVLTPEGGSPMFVKSGEHGGPWGGTQRGGFPRGRGYGFTAGGLHQGNIATHVEGHAAGIMWQRGIKRAELVIDRGFCEICNRDLPSALPPNSKLVVISPTEGKTIVRSAHGQ